jgi:hypothetical protein
MVKEVEEIIACEEAVMQRFNFHVVSTVILLLCTGAFLFAQPPAQTRTGNGVPVRTVITVEARKGNNPPTINREDVMVFEGHDRDVVTEWQPAAGDRAALEFFILIDDSSASSIDLQFSDIRKFIDAQPPSTLIGVAYMQNGIARVVQNLTPDHDLASKALRLPLGFGGANASPYFSLSDLIKRWPASNARHEVLMISDGIDLYYGSNDFLDPYLDAAITGAQKAGIIVSAIYNPGAGHLGHSYWLNYWGQLYLSRLAEATGGEGYYIGMTGSPVTFTPYLSDITQRLTHQYWLTFLAKPPKKSGMQRVKFSTEVPNADLVGPEQVYVPAQ